MYFNQIRTTNGLKSLKKLRESSWFTQNTDLKRYPYFVVGGCNDSKCVCCLVRLKCVRSGLQVYFLLPVCSSWTRPAGRRGWPAWRSSRGWALVFLHDAVDSFVFLLTETEYAFECISMDSSRIVLGDFTLDGHNYKSRKKNLHINQVAVV